MNGYLRYSVLTHCLYKAIYLTTSNVNRRLAEILAADGVGYSRLMGEDESGAVESLRFNRQELIEPKITEPHGRIVKLMGDGLLAELPSALEAAQFKSIPNLNHSCGLGDQFKGVNKIMEVCRILV